MKKDILIFKKVLIFAVLLIFPACTMVFAQSSAGAAGENPIIKFLNNVINFLAKVGSALGVLLLIVAGFYFVTAKGDNSKIEKARTMVLWVLIGIAVVVFSKVLIELVTSFSGGSTPGYNPGT